MSAMTLTDTTPRVWVGCLTCYNSGRLVGDWFPAGDAGGVTTYDIHGAHSHADSHDELWCFDHENLPIDRECSPSEAAEWGRLLADVDDWQRDALIAWVRSGDYIAEGRGNLPSLPDFEERFAGVWETFRQYAENLADDIGLLADAPEIVASYFDWDAWTRDLAHDYTTEPAPNGGVFVFRSL